MNQFCLQQDRETGVAVLDTNDQAGIRVDKVLDIRRQLGEGRYSLADRLDVVVDRLMDVLNRQAARQNARK